MGRDCSKIMDIMLTATDRLLEGAYEALGVDPDRVTLNDIRDEMDALLRSHVRAMASTLEDLGWDTPEETEQFWRFAQEIMGYDDGPYEGFLRHKVTEATQDGTPEDILTAAQRLKDHTDKMKAGSA